MNEINWSKEQLDVINSIDSNTLVSASAGSGKTAVMIERLIRIIASGTPITEIVMVTFNNSVAQELRLKVSKALKKELEITIDTAKKEYLREQIEMVPMANISTLHSLCTTIIRENFEEISVDPSFGIIDEESAALLFDASVNAVLQQYENGYNKDFEMLYKYLTRYGFKDIIKKLYDFIVAQPDRDDYFDRILEYSTVEDLNKKPIIIKYFEMMKAELNDWKDEYESFCEKFIELGFDREKFVDKHAQDSIETLETMIYTKNIEEMFKASLNAKISTSPSLKGEEKDDIEKVKVQERYKDLNARVRSTIKELQGYAYTDFKVHKDMSIATAPYIKIVCSFVRDVIDVFGLKKIEENKLDFNDLEYYAVRILSNDDIAQEYKEKFKYVCVDEYQDINAVQEYILNKISNGNNLFMVGDSKQSIYGFRQTDTNIFLNKLKDYKKNAKKGKAYYLNANYRSEECILNFVNEIFDEIMTEDFGGVDYRNEARLVFGQKDYQQLACKPIEVAICHNKEVEEEEDEEGPYYPENWVYSIEQDNRQYEDSEFNNESLYIVKKIKDLVGKQDICTIDDGKAVNRTIEYKDIAILCSKRSDVKDIINAFKKYDIPADTSEMEMGDTSNEVNILLEILKTIDNPRQDYALICAMTSFVGNITMSELVEIREKTKQAVEDSLEVDEDGRKRKIYFFEYVNEIIKQEGELANKVRNFVAKLDKYRVVASFSKVSDLLKRIIYENNYDEIILMKEGGKQRLNQVFSYIETLKDKYYNNSIAEFIKVADEEPLLKGVSQSNSIDANSVIMSTLHQSKGLEYPVVFYVGCCNQFNSRGGKSALYNRVLLDKDYGMAMPNLDVDKFYYEESLVYHAMNKYQKLQELKERMRLMYVGLTRAKNMLFVTGNTKSNSENKHIMKAYDAKSFMDWVLYASQGNDTIKEKYFSKENIELENLPEPKALEIKFNNPNNEKLKQLLESLNIDYKYEDSKYLGVKHTVTSINKMNYDEAQQFDNANYMPEGNGISSAAVGTAMHRALQLIDFDIDNLKDVSLALDNMVKEDKMLCDERALVDDKLILQCLQSSIIKTARNSKVHFREKLFILNVSADVLFPGIKTKDRVMLEGVIDLLIETEDGYILVDYKHTQKSDSLIKKVYQTQLDLYAYAIRLTTGRHVIGKKILVIDDGRVIDM